MRSLPLVAAGLVLLLALALRRRLGRPWSLVAVAVVAVLTVYGSGVVRLPEPEDAVASVGTTLGGWTYALVGALAFLEAAAFVGLVAPGEFAMTDNFDAPLIRDGLVFEARTGRPFNRSGRRGRTGRGQVRCRSLRHLRATLLP
jgi:hypothetical protein